MLCKIWFVLLCRLNVSYYEHALYSLRILPEEVDTVPGTLDYDFVKITAGDHTFLRKFFCAFSHGVSLSFMSYVSLLP